MFYIISLHTFWLVLPYDISKDRRTADVIIKEVFIIYYLKQIDSTCPCACSVIDHRRRQNVVRTTVTHSAIVSCATFLSLPHFDVICDLLLNRRTATWNLFVNLINAQFSCGSVDSNQFGFPRDILFVQRFWSHSKKLAARVLSVVHSPLSIRRYFCSIIFYTRC